MPSPQSFKFVKNQVHSGNVKCLKNISKVFLLFISNFNTIFVTKVDRIYAIKQEFCVLYQIINVIKILFDLVHNQVNCILMTLI